MNVSSGIVAQKLLTKNILEYALENNKFCVPKLFSRTWKMTTSSCVRIVDQNIFSRICIWKQYILRSKIIF